MTQRKVLTGIYVKNTGPAMTCYSAKVPVRQVALIREAFNRSSLTWDEWVRAGIALLRKESDDEIIALIGNPTRVPKDDAEYVRLPIRLSQLTVDEAKALAKAYKSTNQQVYATAMLMRALWVDFESLGITAD